MIYILINNTNNLFQQHCAQNNTLGAQGFVKDNCRQYNCQLKSIRGYPNTFGEMDIERQGLMPDHWQKQNKMKREEKKERHDDACRS